MSNDGIWSCSLLSRPSPIRQHPRLLPRAAGQPGGAGLRRRQNHVELRLGGRRRPPPLQQGQGHELRAGQSLPPSGHAGGGELRAKAGCLRQDGHSPFSLHTSASKRNTSCISSIFPVESLLLIIVITMYHYSNVIKIAVATCCKR